MSIIFPIAALVVVNSQYDFLQTTVACFFLFFFLYGLMGENGLFIALIFCKFSADAGVYAPWLAFTLIGGIALSIKR